MVVAEMNKCAPPFKRVPGTARTVPGTGTSTRTRYSTVVPVAVRVISGSPQR
jgi:hypothetical protein